MSIRQLPHAGPRVVLIDWHATLVDTHDAMYHAIDDVLPRLKELGLDQYPGDSTTDVIAAKEAGVTAVFYNGALWGQDWLDKIFPGIQRHPHRPDAVVDDIPALVKLARWMIAQERRLAHSRKPVQGRLVLIPYHPARRPTRAWS